MTTSPELSDDYFIGLISGTSMDGIDAALVQFGESDLSIAATLEHNYPTELRKRLFAASRDPDSCTLDELGEIDTWVGESFRDASLALLTLGKIDASQVRAIGSHGQTVRHRPDATHRFTLQIGDPSIIATGTGIDTVADFRSADMALGGEGAPLTPAFHNWLFRDDSSDRVVLNIGGIANITILRAGDDVVTGFDTGPGNTLLDAWTEKHQGVAFDDEGRWAADGVADKALLKNLMNDPWFGKAAPKSTGFEYFNLDWLAAILPEDLAAVDVQATLAELTAVSIANSIPASASDVFVCGGGAHNAYLLQRIAAHLPDLGVSTTAAVGLEPDWVEAVAFAWLAMRRVKGMPASIPSVTGASRPALLGALYGA
jgi:anhydro-N-acetylmuramic acid kinase